MTYIEFIHNILNTRGRFACGDEYYERHHIVPKCLGGTNDDENLIDLFAREHFVAHKLLAKENPNNSHLIYAWGCMAWAHNDNQPRCELTPEEYEEARVACAIVISKDAKERLANPENNPMYGKHHSDATRIKISESLHNLPPEVSEQRRKTLSEKTKARLSNKENHPNYGKHFSEETKQKMRENHADFRGEKHPMYGKNHTEESRKKMEENHRSMRGKNSQLSRKVEQYTLLGDFVALFDSTGDASRATNIASSSICRCANGVLKSAGGFVWKYVNKD